MMNSNYFPEFLDLSPLVPYGRPPELSPPLPLPSPPLALASTTMTSTTTPAAAAKISASYSNYYVIDLHFKVD